MQSGYYSATGGMVTQFNRLDVISNNLANLNTTAFKKDKLIIGDFKRVFQNTQNNMPIANNTVEAAKFLNSSINSIPRVVDHYTQFSQGGLKSSGNSLDFALKSPNLFFMVKTPNGVRLTQNGSFVINSEGILQTKKGYPVLPASYFKNSKLIKIPKDATLSVDSKGTLYSKGNSIGQFYIATSNDIKSLKKEGNSLYKPTNVNTIKQSNSVDAVKQGFLEDSNINPVTEMVHLIEANRMVEMYQKVMNSHMNDLNTDAIRKLASVTA